MEGNPPTMILDKTAKYFKKGKFTLYEMIREVKIIALKIEMKRDKKVISRVSNNQEYIRNIKTIYGRRQK